MRQNRQNTSEAAFSILTLDDDAIMTATLQNHFRRIGYRVDIENDPQQAIERIRTGHYDILLLDFLMSPLCGDQVVEQIRQFNQDLYIILLTGHKDMVPPLKTIRTLDIQGYFEKSERFDQLELLVESCAKSIRQMRTIRGYKDGLSTIMESLPSIYNLQAADRIADRILQAASSLLPCVSVSLSLDAAQLSPGRGSSSPCSYISRSSGSLPDAPSTSQVEALLAQLSGRTSLSEGHRMYFPILNDAQAPMGLLSMELKESPKSDQILLVEVFVRQLSSALGNARLHALVQAQHQELDAAYRQLNEDYIQTVTTMRRIVDAKDIYTRGHSDRVSAYSVQIARHMGYDDAFCDQIRIAGLFHDVGKLSIPDEILLKSGRLTDEEYSVIKTHSSQGVDILSNISQFRPLLPAVRAHHERYDGLGYPDGLQGSEIPEMARIIAVADSFDAMTSNRQYRQDSGYQHALGELVRCRGTQFDPIVVDAFLKIAQADGFEEIVLQSVQSVAPISTDQDHFLTQEALL